MPGETQALIVIDLQNDFCPGGALAVAGANEIVPRINALLDAFPIRVLTQDWHPADHASFADNHADAEPYTVIEMPYGQQVLWPAHCVQGSHGAALHAGLLADRADMILRKGFRAGIDSYSAFYENDRATTTGLAGYLRERGATHLTFAGLATDFCVAWSALDAVRLGFGATVLTRACRAIDLEGSLADAMDKMRAAGVNLEP